MLEVIDKGSVSQSHPVPLLFVHGGWHSASCWTNFVAFFADAGYRAAAMSLRGHGGSPTAKRFHACSIADYVDDVRIASTVLPGFYLKSAWLWQEKLPDVIALLREMGVQV